ncbi:hypothetical protein [Sphingomonas bacterium]|uniref:hypothetical protein n=1 Tax=Sphingomonas bacterium TaxID=1895847 RepID=UPI0015764291|nr:hypothetical protein [Sphingomonas bacterium]
MRRRPLAPLWLARPSRWAALSTRRARQGLVIVAAIVLASWLALLGPAPPPVGHDPAARADLVLYEGIVEGVRHGGNYYQVAADALREGGYPLRPFLTFRLPTLATVQGALPRWAVLAALWCLVAAVAAAWWIRLSPAFARAPPRLVAMVLLAGGLTTFVQPELVGAHEIWAGLLIALSLARRWPGRWGEAAAIALAAVLIRETAALYVGVMLVLAAIEGERREALGWAAVLAVLAVAIGLHANAVEQVVRASDLSSPSWTGMFGFGVFVRAMTLSTALVLVPVVLAAPLVGLALIGWASWREPLALRVLATFAAYALLLSLFGRVDTYHWGLLVAPTLLVGLAFAVDGLRDLVAAALDRRRITVRRAVR